MTLTDLPPRIPASKVCELAGYSKGTLHGRIKRGLMPPPIDRGRENLFRTADVLERLGLSGAVSIGAVNPLEKALDALKSS